MIRLAEHSDVVSMVMFSRESYDSMHFDNFGYKMEPVAAERNYHAGIDNPNILILLSLDHGAINGMMVSIITDRNQYYDNHKTAQEIVFHASTAASPRDQFKICDRLRKVSEKLLAAVGVLSLYIATDLRYPGISSMLERGGYKPMTKVLYKDLR